MGHDDGRHVAGQVLRGGGDRLPVEPALLGGIHSAALRIHLVGADDAGPRCKLFYLHWPLDVCTTDSDTLRGYIRV